MQLDSPVLDLLNRLLDGRKAGTRKLSNSDIARRLGVSRQVVGQWRKGEKPIPEQRLSEILALIGYRYSIVFCKVLDETKNPDHQ